MVGIVYCQKSESTYREIEALLLNSGIDARCIAIEEADSSSFEPFSVLINAMDSFYPEDKLDLLVDFFNSGRNMINLCATPFTKSSVDGSTNIRALRSFGIVDDFRPITENCDHVVTENGMRLDTALTGLYGAVYHLCEQDESGRNLRTAHLEHLLEAFDAQDELVATPMIRVVTHNRGSMTFFAFDFNTSMLKTDFWRELFLNVVRKELLGNVLLSVDCSLARYTPDEVKQITVSVTPVNLHADALKADGNASAELSLTLSVYDDQNTLFFTHTEPLVLPYEATFSPEISASSLYRVTATVTLSDITIAKKETGFLVLSEKELMDRMHAFKPMYIDETISTDYCLVDGKVTAILGTTYFVTDVYRECFYDMNAWLCAKEMAQLSKIGFNVLRSGNWTYIADFYNADGSISLRGLRALQTYFLLAAENGFTVQFALGNVMLNQWDTGRSPIHDPDMRKKCMTYVRSFAEHFKDYPNVTLDIVNEPSYSIKGAWSTGKPSGEPGELTRYRAWLSEKYHGNIHELRSAWGESSATLKCFDDIQMPDPGLFSRGLCRTEQRFNHTPLADFYAFARHEFLCWTAEVRATLKAAAPDMLVTMGRDETLRIPAQQDEVLAGNVDMVCWHQWNYNSNIINEYLLNRVRGKICVAQELGMYKYDDIRAGKRHSDEEMAAKLEKKLLYAFGNFVQWQAHDDPYMFELSENSLGLYRADMSPTPSLSATKRLIAAEKKMQSYLYGRQDEKVRIATVYNTSHYFSVDHQLAQQGIKNHIYALYNCLKEQSDFLPEHLLQKEHAAAIGNPRLILLPAMQTLNENAWNVLLDYVRNGAVLLINGCIDQDEYFAPDKKIAALDSRYSTRKLMNFEKLTIGGKEYVLDFRQIIGYGDVSNILNCGQFVNETAEGSFSGSEPNATQEGIAEHPIGAGTVLYCPYPLELSSNTEAVCACYRYAMEKAQAHNEIYRIVDSRPNVVFTAVSYTDCTVYTLLNEGFADSVCFTDLRSGKTLTVKLAADHGCKIWLDKNGDLLEVFGSAEVYARI